MSTSRTVTGLVVAAGLLLGGGVAGGALAATGALASTTPSPSPSAPSAPSAPGDRMPGDHGPGDHRGPGGHGRGMHGFGLGGQMLHGEVVVRADDGTTQTLLVQHGTVTAKTSDTVTVRSSDGFTTTWTVTSDTRLRVGRPGAASSSLADVATGADVMVVGPRSGKGATARMLGVRPDRADRPDTPGPRGGSTPSPSPNA